MVVGHTYRVRVKHKDSTDKWSHWSDPVQFIASAPDTASDLATHLRVSEAMYDPIGGGDFEYIELYNASGSTTIEFNGEAFTDGIDYVIPAGTQIPPNGYLLVSKDASPSFNVFRANYGLGAGVPIIGPYTGGLNNGGETCRNQHNHGWHETACI